MTDYRTLCAELVERAPDARRMDGIQSWEALLARARAALAVAEPGDAQMIDPIRTALDRLLVDIRALVDESTGVEGLHKNGDIAPWSELLEDGPYSSWLGDGMAEASEALAQPSPPAKGDPSDDDLLRIADEAVYGERGEIFDALEEGYPLELSAVDVLEICRAVYRVGRTISPPAPLPAGEGEK